MNWPPTIDVSSANGSASISSATIAPGMKNAVNSRRRLLACLTSPSSPCAEYIVYGHVGGQHRHPLERVAEIEAGRVVAGLGRRGGHRGGRDPGSGVELVELGGEVRAQVGQQQADDGQRGDHDRGHQDVALHRAVDPQPVDGQQPAGDDHHRGDDERPGLGEQPALDPGGAERVEDRDEAEGGHHVGAGCRERQPEQQLARPRNGEPDERVQRARLVEIVAAGPWHRGAERGVDEVDDDPEQQREHQHQRNADPRRRELWDRKQKDVPEEPTRGEDPVPRDVHQRELADESGGGSRKARAARARIVWPPGRDIDRHVILSSASYRKLPVLSCRSSRQERW